MEGLLIPIVVLIACATSFAFAIGRKPLFPGILWLGFVLHLCSAIAQVWITQEIYGFGDMLSYWRVGSQLAMLLEEAPALFLPEIWALITQSSAIRVPVAVHGIGSSTGSVIGYAAILAYLTRGSLVAACMAIATSALIGKLLVFRVLSPLLPDRFRRGLLVVLVALPSVTFWSAGLLKESLSMLPLCLGVWGSAALVRRRRIVGTLALVTSALMLATLKAYLLLPLVIALGTWLYAERAVARRGTLSFRPLPLLATSLAVLAVLLGMGELFPRYALSNIEAEANRLQTLGVHIEGGSNYQLLGSSAPTDRGPLTQALLLPLALMTSLFRPFAFEVRNGLSAVAGVETAAALFFTVRALVHNGWRTCRDRVLGSPTLLFCLIFTVVAGAAIGLSTTNFGTLSRYRAPMMPFFAIVLLACQPYRSTRHRPLVVRIPSTRVPSRKSSADRSSLGLH